jgi:hypothetical protein
MRWWKVCRVSAGNHSSAGKKRTVHQLAIQELFIILIGSKPWLPRSKILDFEGESAAYAAAAIRVGFVQWAIRRLPIDARCHSVVFDRRRGL